jgi:hypothetical protein
LSEKFDLRRPFTQTSPFLAQFEGNYFLIKVFQEKQVYSSKLPYFRPGLSFDLVDSGELGPEITKLSLQTNYQPITLKFDARI